MKLPQITRRQAIAGGAAVVAVGVATAAGVSRCSHGDADMPAEPTTSGDAAAGKRGGKLVLYTSCNDALVNAVVPAFSQETGIVVDVRQMTTSECRDYAEAEVAAGSAIGDVVWGGDESWFAAGEGCFEKYFSAGNQSVRDDCRNEGGYATPVTREMCVIAVNKALAEKLQLEVKGYESLLAGACAGLVAIPDPETDAAGLSQVEAVLAAGDAQKAKTDASAVTSGEASAAASTTEKSDAAGEAAAQPADAAAGDAVASGAATEALDGQALLAGISAQVGDKVFPTSEDVIEAVLNGEAVAGLVYEQLAQDFASSTGEIEVVYPQEGALVAHGCAAIVKGCDNHEQARSWVDYVTGDSCQWAAAGKSAVRSVKDGVALREGMPADDKLEVLQKTDDDAPTIWDSLRG